MTQEEKLNILKILRDETGMGMMELTCAFDVFINALKRKPSPRRKTDVGYDLECRWKEFDLRNIYKEVEEEE